MFSEESSIEFVRGLITSGPFLVIKAFFIVGILMYGVFAIAVVKQVSIMTESIEDDVNGVVKLLAWVHLLLTVLVLVASVIWL